jgi:hypothetical protein
MTVKCILWLAGTMVSAAAAQGGERPRVYTNEDLDRLSPRRWESGAESRPAVAAAKAEDREDRRGAGDGREQHWRAEAARVREKLLPLRQELDDRKHELEARQRTAGVKIDDARARALEKRIALLQSRIREVEDRLEESARRAGALPPPSTRPSKCSASTASRSISSA